MLDSPINNLKFYSIQDYKLWVKNNTAYEVFIERDYATNLETFYLDANGKVIAVNLNCQVTYFIDILVDLTSLDVKKPIFFWEDGEWTKKYDLIVEKIITHNEVIAAHERKYKISILGENHNTCTASLDEDDDVIHTDDEKNLNKLDFIMYQILESDFLKYSKY